MVDCLTLPAFSNWQVNTKRFRPGTKRSKSALFSQRRDRAGTTEGAVCSSFHNRSLRESMLPQFELIDEQTAIDIFLLIVVIHQIGRVQSYMCFRNSSRAI
jgi:hypothetical protein